MNKLRDLRPKLFESLKDYTPGKLFKDILSGVIVAIIALPLSIALAIASGVAPECGLYTAIFAGFFIALLGGSRVQIGGPTAAFVTIVYGIVAQYGVDGLTVATIMAGIFLIIMGLCRFGTLIRFIPYTITTGFTCGIGVSLLVGQLKDFLGLSIEKVPSDFIPKVVCYVQNIGTINFAALLVGAISVIIIVLLPKISSKIPASLVAIVVATLVVKFTGLPVATIGSVFGELSSAMPMPHLPNVTFEMIGQLIQPAFTIALLAGIESLLSCVVSDAMIGDHHNANAELIGQGVGNIFSGIFGGIPATGAIARTAANVKNGGRTPISGMVHSITLLLVLLIMMPLATMIPMSTLAAVLIVVACNMCDWKAFFRLIKTAPKSDVLVLLTIFVLTVVFDLVIAIEVGIVISALLFMSRMSNVTEVKSWRYEGEDDVSEEESRKLMSLPKSIRIFEITGPLFFAVADRISKIDSKRFTKVIILRMRSVSAIDASALHSLNLLCEQLENKSIRLILSHVNEQPLAAMKKDGLFDRIGAENFRTDINDAVAYAETLIDEK